MENLPFTKHSSRRLCGKLSREQPDNDMRKTKEVENEANDPPFTYQVDNEVWIKNIPWTNERSRLQYTFLEDVITFDTTLGRISMKCRLVYLCE